MKMTMKTAILQGKDFEFEFRKFTIIADEVRPIENDQKNMGTVWCLKNQDKEVEVEDNYWDEDGRAIRELEVGTDYWCIDGTGDIIRDEWEDRDISDKQPMLIGNCFKDKESAEKELERLKEAQRKRMGV